MIHPKLLVDDPIGLSLKIVNADLHRLIDPDHGERLQQPRVLQRAGIDRFEPEHADQLHHHRFPPGVVTRHQHDWFHRIFGGAGHIARARGVEGLEHEGAWRPACHLLASGGVEAEDELQTVGTHAQRIGAVDHDLAREAAQAFHRRLGRGPGRRDHHDLGLFDCFGRRFEALLGQRRIFRIGGIAQAPDHILAMLEPRLTERRADRPGADDCNGHECLLEPPMKFRQRRLAPRHLIRLAARCEQSAASRALERRNAMAGCGEMGCRQRPQRRKARCLQVSAPRLDTERWKGCCRNHPLRRDWRMLGCELSLGANRGGPWIYVLVLLPRFLA